ncbi:MAG: tyrosine-type recombinase/integrase [Desulfovibrio sp.]
MSVNKYKTKAGIRYQGILHVQGTRVATQSGFLTKKEAKAWVHQEEQRWDKDRPNVTRMDFVGLANLYLTEVKDRRKHNTYVYKRGTFRRVLSFFKNTRLSLNEISRNHIAAFHMEQKNKRGAKAANRDLKELVTIFNWANRQDYMTKNPARQVEPYAESSYVRYVPPTEDVEAVRLVATDQERQFIDALYFTAARLSEILELKWEDINFSSSAIRLWTSKRKGGNKEPRVLGMHRDLQEMLLEMWGTRDPSEPYVFINPHTGRKYTRHSDPVRLLFKRVCKRAGLAQPFTAHCIRHHVASRMADSRKATHRQIQQFLGHMNLRTTETYLHDLQVDHDILDTFDDKPEQPYKHQATAQTKGAYLN